MTSRPQLGLFGGQVPAFGVAIGCCTCRTFQLSSQQRHQSISNELHMPGEHFCSALSTSARKIGKTGSLSWPGRVCASPNKNPEIKSSLSSLPASVDGGLSKTSREAESGLTVSADASYSSGARSLVRSRFVRRGFVTPPGSPQQPLHCTSAGPASEKIISLGVILVPG